MLSPKSNHKTRQNHPKITTRMLEINQRHRTNREAFTLGNLLSLGWVALAADGHGEGERWRRGRSLRNKNKLRGRSPGRGADGHTALRAAENS